MHKPNARQKLVRQDSQLDDARDAVFKDQF